MGREDPATQGDLEDAFNTLGKTFADKLGELIKGKEVAPAPDPVDPPADPPADPPKGKTDFHGLSKAWFGE